MTSEAIEAEVISRELVPRETVSLPISVDEALQQWEDYQRLTLELLNETDYQKIGQRQFKKKSAWRKYARAFNITDRVTFEEIRRDETGFPLWARVRVEARATNGRTAEADHECHVTERCCPAAVGEECFKRTWKSHDCCKPGCNGKVHFSHPGDLPATALTRAKNRAISDLIGAGEVSAEEMTEKDRHEYAEDESHRPDAGGARISGLPAANGKGERHMGPMRPVREGEDIMTPRPQDVTCPDHGDASMAHVAAGVSKKTGKPYGSFWTCEAHGCEAGNNGRSYVMFD